MRSRFLLFPVAVVASASAVADEGTQYLTVAQAQASLFPGETFVSQDIFLTEAQREKLKDTSQAVVWSNSVKVWKTSAGGWLFLDQVAGRDDMITYAVAINPDGGLKGVEVLECLPHYDGIRNPTWLGQFAGRRFGDERGEVQIISGASLSSLHITDGVRRVLATYALFFAPGRS